MEQEKRRRLLESTIALIRAMGHEIVIEGVEEKALQDYLMAFQSINELQGFLFSQPVNAPELENLWNKDLR